LLNEQTDSMLTKALIISNNTNIPEL